MGGGGWDGEEVMLGKVGCWVGEGEEGEGRKREGIRRERR